MTTSIEMRLDRLNTLEEDLYTCQTEEYRVPNSPLVPIREFTINVPDYLDIIDEGETVDYIEHTYLKKRNQRDDDQDCQVRQVLKVIKNMKEVSDLSSQVLQGDSEIVVSSKGYG